MDDVTKTDKMLARKDGGVGYVIPQSITSLFNAVLSGLNNGQLKPEHFRLEGHAVLLTDDGRPRHDLGRLASTVVRQPSLAASHRRQDRNLAIIRKSGVEHLFASNVLVVKKNVDVLPKLAPFI